MVNKILFIEGESSSPLKQGFYKLLIKKLKGCMPRLVMGDGVNTTVRKFLNNRQSEYGYLLIDLDYPDTEKDSQIANYHLPEKKDCVFFMIQEMEAWFLSQPEILDEFYRTKISHQIIKKPAKDILHPAEYLMDITKNTDKGVYHKIRHGVQLLMKLNADLLAEEFPDFRNLIDKIRND